MNRTKRRLALIIAAASIVAGAATSAFGYNTGFEDGIGRNDQAITSPQGIVFGTTVGGSLHYADIGSGWYRATSDNGTVSEDGEYFMSGNVAARATSTAERAKISFTLGTASYLTLGYSSQWDFFLEAYDSTGKLLNSTSGAGWTKSLGKSGINYLTVNATGIAYVVAHDDGGTWLIDNVSTDAPVMTPEPGSIFALLLGCVGIARRLRK